MTTPDNRIRAIAASHYGLVTLSEAMACGLSIAQVKHRVRSGEWMRFHQGVYLLAATPRSFEQDVLAAVLAAGPFAVASHRTAAALWGLRGIEPRGVAITVPSGSVGRIAGVTYHRTDVFPVDHWMTRPDGIRVTTPARTLLDLGADATETEVERAVHDAELRGLVGRPELVGILDAIGGKGRRGTAHLRTALERMPVTGGVVESELELRFLRVVVRAYGLPTPVHQHRVGRFRVDFAYPLARLAIELDGRRWHGAASDRARDRRREEALAGAGWSVLRFTWADVHERPNGIATEITAHLRRSLSPQGDHVALANQRTGLVRASRRAWRG